MSLSKKARGNRAGMIAARPGTRECLHIVLGIGLSGDKMGVTRDFVSILWSPIVEEMLKCSTTTTSVGLFQPLDEDIM